MLVRLAFAFVCLFSFAAFAQEAIPAEPDLAALLVLVKAVITDWRAAGALAGAIALFKLLGQLLKVQWCREKLGLKTWVLPLLTSGIGLALAVLGAKASGMAWPQALVAGIFAALTGLGGSGLHELIGNFNPEKRAEDKAGKALIAATLDSDKRIAAEAGPMVAELGEIEKLPEASRSKALAQWAKDHPPAP